MIPVKQLRQNEIFETLVPEFDRIDTIKDHPYYKLAMPDKDRIEMIERVEAMQNEIRIDALNKNLKELKLRTKRKKK